METILFCYWKSIRRTECVHPKWWTAAHLNPRDKNEQHSDPPSTPLSPPLPSCRHPSINPGAHLHSPVHHPPLGMPLCSQPRTTRLPKWRREKRKRRKRLRSEKTTFGCGERWTWTWTTGKESGGRCLLRLRWADWEAERGRGGTPGGYLVMGASRSTGFFISNDRAGAHCSSLKPGDTLTRVLPLCVEKRKPQSHTNTAGGFGWFMGQCMLFFWTWS